jgi:hypothetical protein
LLSYLQAGFFPAATFLLTIWYKRYEYQRRLAFFYASASLAGAFSGLLAFAIAMMNGVGGRTGWQWWVSHGGLFAMFAQPMNAGLTHSRIFILEGLVPIMMAPVVWFYLPDSPEHAKFLKKEEKEFIINRIAVETGSGKGQVTNMDRIKLHHVIAGLSEWKTWLMVTVFWANTVGVYG